MESPTDETVDEKTTEQAKEILADIEAEEEKPEKTGEGVEGGEESKIIPLVTSTEKVYTALWNCANFDHTRFRSWLALQPARLQDIATRCPPDRIYDLAGVYVFIFGYHKDGRVIVKYVDDVSGQKRALVDPSSLRDVTKHLSEKYGVEFL